jgi:hypothetical protein
VVAVAGGGFAFAKATNNGESSSQQGMPGGQGGPGGFGERGDGGQFPGAVGGNLAVMANALHGDFVASNGNGGYETQRMQTGTVTAVTATSLTAKSVDGYTQTYVITTSTKVDEGDDAIGDVKTGDTVTIVATVSGTTATATTVSDTALRSGDDQGQGIPGGNQPSGQPGGTRPSGVPTR